MTMPFLPPPDPQAPAHAAAGQVFVIRCEPDPFTGERINIGVCVQSADGRRHVRCIEEPGRLECLYGPAAVSVVSLAKMAQVCAAKGLPSPSPQVLFDEPLPYYQGTAEDMLRITFQEQVTVALPQRTASGRQQLDDAAAVAQVVAELRKRLAVLGEVVANTPETLVATPQGPQPVTVHLQPRHGVGVIRSVDYTPQTLSVHLMHSVLDLQCAALYRQRKHQALFLLRPQKEPEKLAQQRDDVIDSIMRRAGSVHLEQSEHSEELAAGIVAWAAEAG